MKTGTIIILAVAALVVFYLFGGSKSGQRRGNQFGGSRGSQFAGVNGNSQFNGAGQASSTVLSPS